MSTCLPDDVVIEILSRLPVKSLVRFRCVCKSWCDLIRNPSFISKHLNFANNNKDNVSRLLVKCLHDITYKPMLSFVSYTHENETLDDDALSIDIPDLPFYNDSSPYLLLLGPCNGIFCLYEVDGVSPNVVFNPATREFKALPPSPFPLPPGTSLYFYTAGFGFDPKTNDYKLVKISLIHWRDDSGTRLNHPPQVEVYTLSTDSWRKIDGIDADLPIVISDHSLINSYLNGVYYWFLIQHEDDSDAAILSFDMGDEVFAKIPVPMRFSWEETVGTVALFNGSLAVLLYDFLGTEKCFHIWVMNKYGTEESWTKQLTVGPLSGVETPLGFGKNGALFLFSRELFQLVLYDPVAQVIRNLQFRGSECLLQVALYVESLVSLQARNELGQQNNSVDMVPDLFLAHKPLLGGNQTDSESS